ncbi:MAG: HAD family hydrolase [Thermoplasmatota archaeon]
MQKAAFFDFDKTLLHGDAGVIFGRSLGAYGYEQAKLKYKSRFRRALWHTWVTTKIAGILASEVFVRTLYKLHLIKRSTLVRVGYRFLRGFKVEDMEVRMDRVWEKEIVARLYPEMIAKLEDHRARGDRVVIVTTGLRPLIERAKARLGEVDIIAVDMKEEDGFWTGRVEGPLYGVQKRDAIQAFAAAHDVDLATSTAYSDHYSDLAFLEAVGHPIVVNPKRKLRRIANDRHWEILRVRKPKLIPLGSGPA